MPVGTAASVKAVPQHFLEELGAEIILANTYHLYLRPGAEVVKDLGGLHGFMSWNRPILTDSGGYQVFSHRELRQISEDGVEFKSHLDGSSHFLSPEKAITVQQDLGADVIMAFDDCTPYPVAENEARRSMERSMRWAARCRRQHRSDEQALFGIVQGSMYPNLRSDSLQRILEIGFDGVALGGFSVGEPSELMYELIERLSPELPEEQPRYLMGVGTPRDLLECVKAGIDMFDCVLPTRNARNGTLFTSAGKVRIKNSRYKEDSSPLDRGCSCFVCRRYSRGYLRHLFVSGEILASVLNTYHNLHFFLDLMRRIREAIETGTLLEFERAFLRGYSETE
jgi:queuine tRNA-ribosyltransferase